MKYLLLLVLSKWVTIRLWKFGGCFVQPSQYLQCELIIPA